MGAHRAEAMPKIETEDSSKTPQSYTSEPAAEITKEPEQDDVFVLIIT